jgi:hypothetical protein
MTMKTMPPQASDVRTRLIAVYSFLLLLNAGGWVCAAIARVSSRRVYEMSARMPERARLDVGAE